ncbi:class I SAM-dependent methyltransferase [Rhodopila sp.]|uniref:class I SAM-dependent methyltransferase n=1 Tax=Rhodopila sp. TaxID=2480087 RepID=UPI002CBACFEC|nr:methyltransferase domain-containing protein [Rhodopila sp.]HVZ08113.1 methyltransferase domain-containing protein [Rhodopila sp.]
MQLYAKTFARYLIGVDRRSGGFVQLRSLRPQPNIEILALDEGLLAEADHVGRLDLTSGPATGCQLVRGHKVGTYYLSKGAYLCAPPARFQEGVEALPIKFNRPQAGAWEALSFISPSEATFHASQDYTNETAMKAAVEKLVAEKKPMCLHFGVGGVIHAGYINVDKWPYFGPFENLKNYFVYDFTEKTWPIPSESVDYIYSEDFIEHITQRNQVIFLAEAYRTLKPGGIHRISTPDLASAMRYNSNFKLGMEGTYLYEFDQWRHVALFTRGFIEDLGSAIGYSKVLFTEKNGGSSPYAVKDRRPGPDRTWPDGNLFIDLVR